VYCLYCRALSKGISRWKPIIRINNPTVISSGIEDTLIDEETLLISAKNTGNGLVQVKMYNAASEAYINGIRKAELVPTLLSNRSQACAMTNDWDRSLADAAASLTMHPDNEKSWAHNRKAHWIDFPRGRRISPDHKKCSSSME
jgi:hypothetical protein